MQIFYINKNHYIQTGANQKNASRIVTVYIAVSKEYLIQESCKTISGYVFSDYVFSDCFFQTMPFQTISFQTMSFQTISFQTMSFQTMSFQTVFSDCLFRLRLFKLCLVTSSSYFPFFTSSHWKPLVPQMLIYLLGAASSAKLSASSALCSVIAALSSPQLHMEASFFFLQKYARRRKKTGKIIQGTRLQTNLHT